MTDSGEFPSSSRTTQLDSETFEAVGASVVGLSHEASGKPCQDFFTIELGPKCIVAVVSDGAGSATRALDGARTVSEEICRTLMRRLNEIRAPHEPSTPGSSLWGRLTRTQTQPKIQNPSLSSWVEGAVIEGIERARERCLSLAGEGEHLRAFHATVVGVVLVDEGGMLFHIGDGGASAHRLTIDGIETAGFSEPENGEYANETFFFTENWWREHLRLTEIQAAFDAVWLMTDGAYELMVPRLEKCLRDATVKEIDRLVFGGPVSNKCDVLVTILSSQQAASKNDDDKTLVVIRRRK